METSAFRKVRVPDDGGNQTIVIQLSRVKYHLRIRGLLPRLAARLWRSPGEHYTTRVERRGRRRSRGTVLFQECSPLSEKCRPFLACSSHLETPWLTEAYG